MGYLNIAKQAIRTARGDEEIRHALCNEIDEIDEASAVTQGDSSSISSISSLDAFVFAHAETLRRWLTTGQLAMLPDPVPGMDGVLESYADRRRMIGLVRTILDALPWSLTAQERAVQLVHALTRIIEGDAP